MKGLLKSFTPAEYESFLVRNWEHNSKEFSEWLAGNPTIKVKSLEGFGVELRDNRWFSKPYGVFCEVE